MRDPPSAWHRASYSEEYFGTQGNPLVRGTYKVLVIFRVPWWFLRVVTAPH